MQFGKPILIENISEEIDQIIEPILLKKYYKKEGRYLIRLGSVEITYNLDFKL